MRIEANCMKYVCYQCALKRKRKRKKKKERKKERMNEREREEGRQKERKKTERENVGERSNVHRKQFIRNISVACSDLKTI